MIVPVAASIAKTCAERSVGRVEHAVDCDRVRLHRTAVGRVVGRALRCTRNHRVAGDDRRRAGAEAHLPDLFEGADVRRRDLVQRRVAITGQAPVVLEPVVAGGSAQLRGRPGRRRSDRLGRRSVRGRGAGDDSKRDHHQRQYGYPCWPTKAMQPSPLPIARGPRESVSELPQRIGLRATEPGDLRD